MNDRLTLRSFDSIKAIEAGAWDHCAGTADPFVSHAFLSAMEESGSACIKSGWQPVHLVAERNGSVAGVAPLYVKYHSYGEYVFDWGWAQAWEKAGHDYYPKLQCAVPFTPVGGRRFLIRPGEDDAELCRILADAMAGIAERNQLSSSHVTFLSEDEARLAENRGWLLRMGEQFHWANDGYGGFEDFLAALSSRKRKAIRKERDKAKELGARIHTLSGADLRPEHWDAFYGFYLDTAEKKWGQAYLTRDFFDRLTGKLADQTVLFLAEMEGKPVAGALNFLGADTLYGRNWGCLGDFRFLHFEMCYYRAIDFAIERGLARVEAGAQGEHKISRGYLPVPTYSVHWIREAPLRRAVADFLEREKRQMALQIEEGRAAGPFREE